jgi:hypothetical protein
MTRFHLGIASTHLSVPRRLLTHGMLAVSRASLLAAFAGTHFSLVALKVLVVAGVFVPVFFGIHSFSLPAMFSHVPVLLFNLSRSRPASFFAWPFIFSTCHALSFCTWSFTFSTCHTLSFRTWSFTFSTRHTLSFCASAFALASAFGFVE